MTAIWLQYYKEIHAICIPIDFLLLGHLCGEPSRPVGTIYGSWMISRARELSCTLFLINMMWLHLKVMSHHVCLIVIEYICDVWVHPIVSVECDYLPLPWFKHVFNTKFYCALNEISDIKKMHNITGISCTLLEYIPVREFYIDLGPRVLWF